VRITTKLKGGEMVSKKEQFGVFRADNNPEKREVNRLQSLKICERLPSSHAFKV
jgi:hypothetical protein